MRKGYFDIDRGQIHARFWHEDMAGYPLVCLPPAPHTGLYFSALAKHLHHPIIAIDYPGSGGSTSLLSKPAIVDYANVIGQLLRQLGKAHLLGFHTGCLIAVELAQLFQDHVEKLICIDFPLFDQAVRLKYAAATNDVEPPQTPSDLSKSFNGTVVKRREAIGETRALELWIESLRAGPRYNDPFQAAFGFDGEAAVKSIGAQIEFIATQSNLLEPTRQASKLAPSSRLTELPDIEGNVFETGAPKIASTIHRIIS
jgi:pimeloyl-ACP methyl ester carboxylesterase